MKSEIWQDAFRHASHGLILVDKQWHGLSGQEQQLFLEAVSKQWNARKGHSALALWFLDTQTQICWTFAETHQPLVAKPSVSCWLSVPAWDENSGLLLTADVQAAFLKGRMSGQRSCLVLLATEEWARSPRNSTWQ